MSPRSSIASGRLTQRVTLEVAAAAAPDGDGGYTETYVPLDPPEACVAIESAPGMDQRIANTAIVSAIYHVTLHYRRDLTTKVRLAFVDKSGRQRLLWVRGMENLDEANVTVRLSCEEQLETVAPMQQPAADSEALP
jgi:head-tail adaptor